VCGYTPAGLAPLHELHERQVIEYWYRRCMQSRSGVEGEKAVPARSGCARERILHTCGVGTVHVDMEPGRRSTARLAALLQKVLQVQGRRDDTTATHAIRHSVRALSWDISAWGLRYEDRPGWTSPKMGLGTPN
jgi:hypothetical protein